MWWSGQLSGASLVFSAILWSVSSCVLEVLIFRAWCRLGIRALSRLCLHEIYIRHKKTKLAQVSMTAVPTNSQKIKFGSSWDEEFASSCLECCELLEEGAL